jgi:hypothetical protein
MTQIPAYAPWLDKLAVSTSALCAIHCLSLPLLLGFVPALGTTVFGQESFHVLLLWLVVPLSLVGLSMSCRSHKDGYVVVLGAVGLAILIGTAVFGHDLLGETGERVMTLLGAIAIAAGHLRNYTLCRRMRCDH